MGSLLNQLPIACLQTFCYSSHIQRKGDPMRRILAALAFLAAIAGAPAVSQATTVQIAYTGAITQMFDPAGLSGFSPGDSMTGSMTMTFDGMFYDGGNAFTATRFFEGFGTAKVGTIEISGPHYSDPNAYANQIYFAAQDTHEEWDFQVSDSTAFTTLRFVRNAIAPIIPTLGANVANLRSLVDAGLLSLTGELSSGGPTGSWVVDFTADPSSISVTTTPVPAALPLFASALGGLGIFGWKRRKNAQAAE
jgi:hypothetical protein